MTTDPPSDRPLRKDIRRTAKSAERAIDLRRRLSPPEGILWSRLRGRRLGGLRFRRQHPLGPWIADFYCHEAALVVEVDGWTHFEPGCESDAERDAWMRDRGVEVLRISAAAVNRDVDAVAQLILKVALRRIEALEGR